MRISSICLAVALGLFGFDRSSEALASPKIDPKRSVKIQYASAAWNHDSKVIDTAFLFIKDSSTGKLIKVILEETEPDSATFAGSFSITHRNAEAFAPEVFIPPQEARSSENATSDFSSLVASGKAKKKPVVFSRSDERGQVVDVYDTREQAERALNLLKEQARLEEAKTQLTRPAATPVQMDLAASAEKAALLARLATEAASRENERLRLEQLEKQRAEDRKKKAQALAAAEREARKQKALELVAQAMQHYEKGEFPQAEELFRVSTELDPTNQDFYFKYGVVLYRNEKFNEALVVLKLSHDEPSILNEKLYYLGLIHYRLKELEPAKSYFHRVRGSGVEPLASASAFYQGVIEFGEEKWDPAKGSFEFVLDHSKDPTMDQRAEEYIEKIAQIQRFQSMAKTRHVGIFTVGLMYDSNILYAPDGMESQGFSKDGGGIRMMASGDYQYRFLFTRDNEFATRVTAMTLYSLDSQFAAADPMVVNGSLPYAWKGTWGVTPYRLALIPAYEGLLMDPAGVNYPGNLILSSPMVRLDLTLIMSQDWFANYFFEGRHDTSSSPDSVGDTNANAPKFTLRTSQSFFMSRDKKTALIANAGYIHNEAIGRDRRYRRYEIGALYTQPIPKWEASWVAGLSGYFLDYPDSTDGRQDFNVTTTAGLNKPISQEWIAGLTANYTSNSSETPTFQYSKFTVLTTLTYRLNQ